MTHSDTDRLMMLRALTLAAAGDGYVSPNPMVGAVITAPDGKIIGEGWHRHYGGPHAEVNAVRSVSADDALLLPQSTIYVTLEPCSHYGKTPPCAKLLIEKGFKRVVVGATDPNPLVAGRGLEMLRQAGIAVEQGLLADECRRLNRTFFLSQTLRRPFVTLKWACSADGYMDRRRSAGESAYRFSDTLTQQLTHLRRARHDAIAVGGATAVADNPRLDVRLIDGRSPKPVIFDRHRLADATNCRLIADGSAIHITDDAPLDATLRALFADHHISSLLVEGGPRLLSQFISAGLWDEAYVEVSSCILGDRGAAQAPALPAQPVYAQSLGSSTLLTYVNTRHKDIAHVCLAD